MLTVQRACPKHVTFKQHSRAVHARNRADYRGPTPIVSASLTSRYALIANHIMHVVSITTSFLGGIQ